MNIAISLSFTNVVKSFTRKPSDAEMLPTFDSALVACMVYRLLVCTGCLPAGVMRMPILVGMTSE